MSRRKVAEPIPMLDVAAQNGPIADELRMAFERVLGHGHFVLGPEVEQFEGALREHFGYAHAIGVSSGSDALLLALMALDIGPGDEVITTPFTFFATAGAIARLGAKPVFVDIEPQSFNLDVTKVEAAVTERTRAIIAVHLYGQPVDLQAVMEIAGRHSLRVIEDAAQAMGAQHDGKAVGTIGDVGCFSFFPTKSLGGFGDGGLVVAADDALAEKLRTLRGHGANPKYFHSMVGGNFRLDALQAALLSVKLPHLEEWTEGRRRNAARYEALFAGAGLPESRLRLPGQASAAHVFNQYVVRSDRQGVLQDALKRAGISSEIYYPRGLHLQECFASLGHKEGDFPETERACGEVLALPVYAEMSEADVVRVAQTVVRALSG